MNDVLSSGARWLADGILAATPIVYFSVLSVISLYGFHKVLMIWRFYKYQDSYRAKYAAREHVAEKHSLEKCSSKKLSNQFVVANQSVATRVTQTTRSPITRSPITYTPINYSQTSHRHPKCIQVQHSVSQTFATEAFPSVTVQLPIFNELYVVERLLDAIARLHYPPNKLEIQVLDDSTDETQYVCQQKVAALQRQGLNIRYIRRPHRKGFKAGALDYGLQQAAGELITLFDADFVPMPDTLLRLVHSFADPAVGMVQARWSHLNRQYSLLTEIQALMLDGHFVIEQTSRSRSGCFFNFNGTAGVWRASAIADAGGWQHTTVTEDLDLSYRVQLKGWRCLYLPHIVVPAELPAEMNSFKSQQFRWAKGASQVARKLLGSVFRAPVPFHVKCEAFFHLTNNFNYLLMMVLLLLSFPYQVYITQHEWSYGVLAYLPLLGMTTLNLVCFYWVSQREQRPVLSSWRLLSRIFCLLSVGIGMSLNQSLAVCDGFLGAGADFVRTPKHGIITKSEKWKTKKYRGAKTWVLCLEMLMVVYLAFTIAFALHHGNYSSLPFLLMFFTGYCYVLTLGLFQRR
ncbi:MAG: glycosyltransferase [Cyanobacteria bacterium P01_C01_bin.69]